MGLKRILFNREVFVDFLKTGTTVKIVEGLPKDSKIVASRLDTSYDRFVFIVDSKEFETIHHNCEIPIFNLILEDL